MDPKDRDAFDKLTKAIEDAGSMEKARDVLSSQVNTDLINGMSETEAKRLFQTVKLEGGTAAPLVAKPGTIGSIRQAGVVTNIVGSSGTPLITINQNQVTHIDSNVKEKIRRAA